MSESRKKLLIVDQESLILTGQKYSCLANIYLNFGYDLIKGHRENTRMDYSLINLRLYIQ